MLRGSLTEDGEVVGVEHAVAKPNALPAGDQRSGAPNDLAKREEAPLLLLLLLLLLLWHPEQICHVVDERAEHLRLRHAVRGARATRHAILRQADLE